MTERAIYLDYNATTPIDPAVADAMLPYLHEHFGNPSSTHPYGVETRTAVEKARRQVARLIGARPEEIVLTSGGSESNNTVIQGVARQYRAKGRHIILDRQSIRGANGSIMARYKIETDRSGDLL